MTKEKRRKERRGERKENKGKIIPSGTSRNRALKKDNNEIARMACIEPATLFSCILVFFLTEHPSSDLVSDACSHHRVVL
jgi:hypothetical protein